MRIGFFGNNNNYPLLLAEAIRRAGHDVWFVLNKAHPLHRPESRDPAAYGPHPDWVFDASHLTEHDYMELQPPVGPLLDRLADCDALVLNDLGPSLLPLLDRPAVTFLTGSDLDYYASLTLPDLRLRSTSPEYREGRAGRAHRRMLEDFVERQRLGLRSSVAINWALPGLFPDSEALLAECGVEKRQIFNLQMADLARIAVTPPPDNAVLRVFCGTRLTWKLPVAEGRSALDYKGTDVMVRGVAQFCRRTGKRVELCLVRKGMHIAETEALVAEEGLGDQVVWLSEMPLQELWRQFLASDVIVEQLGVSVISMVAMDAMACARPVIGNARPEVPTLLSAPGSPICQARTPEEVCSWIERLSADEGERRRLGQAGRAFVEANFSPDRAAALCLERLAAAAKPPSTSRTSLLGALARQRADREQTERQLGESIDLNTHLMAVRQQLTEQLRETAAELQRAQQQWSARLDRLRQELSAEQDRSQHATDDELDRLHGEIVGFARQRDRLRAVLQAMCSKRTEDLQRRVLKGPFRAEGPRGWLVTLEDLEHWADGDEPARSGLLLLEDQRLLGPAHCDHDSIRQLGEGRFSHWRATLYFSTTDGSDPNRNGRRYTIFLPTPSRARSGAP
ncbi:MAG TPA: glycosyltransferase [Planctomycetota bacterium]|nr:glycosyltransferase [Planctomycetota bacterium]